MFLKERMTARRGRYVLFVLVVGVLCTGALIVRTRLTPKSPSTLDHPPSDAELRSQKSLAESGNLAAAEGLRGHYCLFTDENKTCEYWVVRVAELGDEQARCAVISNFDGFKSYAQFADRIAVLRAKGGCT